MQCIHKAKLLKSLRLYSSDWIVAQVLALRHWGIGRVGVAVWGWDLEEGAGERKGGGAQMTAEGTQDFSSPPSGRWGQ